MNKLTFLCLLCVLRRALTRIGFYVILFLNGCGAGYAPAVWDARIPSPYPPGNCSEGMIATVDFNKGNGFKSNESNYLLRGSVMKVSASNWWNVGVGGFLYGGVYNVTQHPDSAKHGKLGYLGLGPSGEANIFLTLKKLNVGVGMFLAGAFEFGSYTKVYANDISALMLEPVAISVYPFAQYNLTQNRRVVLRFVQGDYESEYFSFAFFEGGKGFWLTWNPSIKDFLFSLGMSLKMD